MLCLFPRQIKNPRYEIDAPVDPTVKRWFDVPCGKCYACLINKSRDWYTRIYFEKRVWQRAYFVTLTYDDRFCDGNVHKDHLQKWFKRLRKAGFVFKYFAISEYGPKTQRPHYHVIILTDDRMKQDDIRKSWKKGFITISNVNGKRIYYCTRYMSRKETHVDGKNDNFMLSSRRPALGFGFFEKSLKKHLDQLTPQTLHIEGVNYRVPRYYLNKLDDQVRREYRRKLQLHQSQFEELLKQDGYEDLAILQAEDKRKLEKFRKKSKI